MYGDPLYRDYQRRSELDRRGFDSVPSEEELLLCVFSLQDKLDTLSTVLGVRLVQDVRGRWGVMRGGSDG